MITQLLRRFLRVLAATLAGSVAAVMFGPTLAANAAGYFRAPLRASLAARDTVDNKRKPAASYTVSANALEHFAATQAALEVAPVLPFVEPTPTTSSVTITPVVEATMTPGVTPTAAAHDSAPVPSLPASPVAIATTDTPTPTPTPVKTTPKPTPSPIKTTAHTIVAKPVESAVRLAKVLGVLSFARLQLGERYVMGGMGPNVWDCSGLTKASFARMGIDIGTHSSNNQYETARADGYLVPFADKEPGDLVFYGTPGDIYHVAIYSGNGKIIEAANASEPVEERAYWGTPYTEVARFIR